MYFFARRLGIVATMVCEPFYAENFRRSSKTGIHQSRRKRQLRVYLQGLGLAVALFIVMAAMVFLTAQMPMIAPLIPAAVLLSLPLFSLVLLVDCLLAANRWSRFMAQLNGGSAQLLAVRLTLFLLFALNVWLFGNGIAGLGLALALALSWILEAVYLLCQLLGKLYNRKEMV